MVDRAYGIRTDLNTPQSKVKRAVAKNQTYGKATEQLESQRAVPMGGPPTETQSGSRPAPRKSATPFDAPSERPDEPITEGAPFGPGMGPAAAGIPMYNSQIAAVEELKLFAQLDQNSDLADLASRWMS